MAYAIIRNSKLKMGSVGGIGRHNERLTKNHANDRIDPERTKYNFHFKKPIERSYEKEFYRIKDEQNYGGKLVLTGDKQSNVLNEFVVTSDEEYLGDADWKTTGKLSQRGQKYFEDAYRFICDEYGEKNIVSAVIHMDEDTPHMHVAWIPIGKCKKTIKHRTGEISDDGKPVIKKEVTYIDGVNCSDVWKGFNSYGKLQDKYYDFIKENGHDLERGDKVDLNASYKEKRQHKHHMEWKIEQFDKAIEAFEQELADAEQSKDFVRSLTEKSTSENGMVQFPTEEWQKVLKMLMLYAKDKENIKARENDITFAKITSKALQLLQKTDPETYSKFADVFVKAQEQAQNQAKTTTKKKTKQQAK